MDSLGAFGSAYDERNFWSQLNETMAWCGPRGSMDDPKRSLRSFRNEIWYGDLSSRSLRVRHLADVRSRHLRETGCGTDASIPNDLAGGRLLAYFPDINMCDGLAEAVSAGFFDVHNTPPHDTWVDFIVAPLGDPTGAGFLVAWVPPALLDLAHEGVEVNPEGCILWLDTYEHPLVDELRRRSLIA